MSTPRSQGGQGNIELIEAIGDHVERWIGPIQGVFHEENSTEVHVDVYWVAPDEERPFHTLVTCGASQRAMRSPRGAEQFTHMELVAFLPPDWNLSEPSREERWPIFALRALARYPHKHNTWIWGGHTVPLGYEDASPFTAAVLTRPYLLDPKGGRLEFARKRIEFLCLACLRPEEAEMVRRTGERALIERADAADALEDLLVVTKSRPSFA